MSAIGNNKVYDIIHQLREVSKKSGILKEVIWSTTEEGCGGTMIGRKLVENLNFEYIR